MLDINENTFRIIIIPSTIIIFHSLNSFEISFSFSCNQNLMCRHRKLEIRSPCIVSRFFGIIQTYSTTFCCFIATSPYSSFLILHVESSYHVKVERFTCFLTFLWIWVESMFTTNVSITNSFEFLTFLYNVQSEILWELFFANREFPYFHQFNSDCFIFHPISILGCDFLSPSPLLT